MFSIISTAFGYLLLLIIVVTPVGQWLLLSSSFWTAGMEIIFYFVDNDYPDKVVAFVSAIVAILFVYIVRVIWNVLPPLVDLPSNDEAVCAVRPVASAAAGKYGMSHQDFLVESASSFSSSVSGSHPNHTDHEYHGPVGGSSALVVARPNLIMPETDTVFASLSLDGLRMPEVEKKAYHGKYAKNVLNASNCVSRFLPVDKQLVAVPCPAAVADASADASWRSDLAESNNVSLSSASRSTGVSDSGFVASASNATDMTKAVDADVSCGRVAGADPLGDDAGSASASACFGADDGVVATSGGDDTQVGAASGDAMLDGPASALGAVPSGVPVSGASSATLVCPIVSVSASATRGSHVGMKRCCDWEFALLVHQEPAKKKKVAPVCDSFCLPSPMEDVAIASAAEPMEVCPPSPVLMDLGFSSVEPMDICPPSPSPMDLASLAVKPMDLDCDEGMDLIIDDSVPLVCEASPMDITADGLFSLGLLATSALSAATNAAPTTPSTAIATTALPPTASTAAIRRCIAYPRARSALRHPVGRNVAQQQQATTSTSTTTSTTRHVAAAPATTITTTATTATVAATAADTTAFVFVAAKATSATEHGNSNGKNNKNHNGNQVKNTTSATRIELEEFDLNPADILDANDYPEDNCEYDEFEGYDFTEGLDLVDRLG